MNIGVVELMHENKKIRTFIGNLIYAFTAQGISLILSFLMSLIVPKLLGVREFGYWQLFIFYSGYVGFFLFGLNDGIYLRYGGKKYNELDYPLLGSQFWVAIFGQIVIAVGVSIYALYFMQDKSRSFVLIFASIYLLIFNASGYLSYIFQAVNRTKIFSISVIIDKVFFIISVVILLILKEKHFEIFSIFYLIGKLLCLFYCLYIGHKIVFVHLLPVKTSIHEMSVNISVGINLMFSNIASMLILGVSRFIIDSLWGVEIFGKISFSLSLTSFFLMFISQVSMVLFPALRQTDRKHLQQIYRLGRDGMGIILAGVFLLYVPIKYILGLWLPQYKESLVYLALLLPICTFDGKMEMLCSTYLKVLRKEKMLLAINLMSLGVSVVLCMVSGYLFHSLYAIIISMVIAIAFRSIVSDVYLSRIMGITVFKDIVPEVFLVSLFVVCTICLNSLWSFTIYFIAYGLYLLFSKNKIHKILSFAKIFSKPEK